MEKRRLIAGAFQRNVGIAGALLFGSMAGRGALVAVAGVQAPPWGEVADPLVLAAMAVVFLASSHFALLRAVQPLALLAVAPVHAAACSEYPCGLAASVSAAILLYRMGFFVRRRRRRTIAFCAISIAAELAVFALVPRPLPSLGLSLCYCAVFCAIFVAMIRYGDGSDISSRKAVLRLASFGLTARERRFVRQYLEGKSVKEIAYDSGRSSSTVRNAFCSIYRRLGIARSEELAALGERYRIDYRAKSEERPARPTAPPHKRGAGKPA